MKKILSILFIAVTLMMIQSCSDDYPVPPASSVPLFSFTIDNNEFAPATVTFKNESVIPDRAGKISYYWNFDDGTSSTEQSLTHYYKKPGSYKVNLVLVTELSNEINEVTKTIVIKDPNATGIPVFFTDGTNVYTGLINSQAPVVSTIGITGLGDSYGMALDTVNNKLYIADFDGKKIYVADPDGTNQKTFRTNIGEPDAVAIDYGNQMIYWDTSDGIRSADMTNDDVNQFYEFVTGQANDPEGISIDEVHQTLYWNNYDGSVWMKNLDGSGDKEIIVTGGGGSVLVVGDKIYFDDYVASGDIRLKSADLDGSNVATIATNISKVVYGISFDSHGNKIYWVDRSKGIIMRADEDGGKAEPWYTNAPINPRGIVIGKKK